MRNNSVNIYSIADTHFSHSKLVANGMKSEGDDARVIKDLRIVKRGDVLIHLGDVSFYNHGQWHRTFTSLCAGKKILILGNHDRQTLTWYYNHGWDFVCTEFKLSAYGKNLVFSHAPLSLNSNEINIHGHLHDDRHHTLPKSNGHFILVYNNLVNVKTLLGK